MAVLKAFILLFALLAIAHGGAVNRGGCTEDMCAKVQKIKPSAKGPRELGYYFGIYNQRLNRSKVHDRRGPIVNYEAYRVSE